MNEQQERIDAAIKKLESMKHEAGIYYVAAKRSGKENDARYLDRIYKSCDNIIAILKGKEILQ